ncbi:MAG: TetR/AcrR family transcriptional regulator [Candidatus Binatia bacterium]
MAHVSRKEILQDFRTRSLLEATRKIIAAEGFDAVTMERVGSEAGITKGGIYLYFRNKNQMILAALEEIATEMLREIESQVDSKAQSWTRLCQVVRAQMESMERHKDLLRTLLLVRWLLSDQRERKKWRRLLQYRERHLNRLKAILDDGVRQKTFYPMDTARGAFYINEMMISTALRRMVDLSQLPLTKETEGLIQFLALLLRDKKHFQKSEEKT